MNNHNLSCEQVRDAMASGAQLIDVRSTQEFVQGALPGAINLPVTQLPEKVRQIDSSRPVLVYCASGQRGEMAAQYLRGQGFSEVMNLGANTHYQAC